VKADVCAGSFGAYLNDQNGKPQQSISELLILEKLFRHAVFSFSQIEVPFFISRSLAPANSGRWSMPNVQCSMLNDPC
jgi:hypothetical protein